MPNGDAQAFHQDRKRDDRLEGRSDEVIAQSGQMVREGRMEHAMGRTNVDGHGSRSVRSGSLFVAAAAVLALLVPAQATAQDTAQATAQATAQDTNTRLSYQVPSSEVGSVAVDGSAFSNDGALRGGVSRGRGVYKFHRLSRDGRYDRISAPDDPSLSPGPGPFSYGVRLKVSPDAEWSHSEMAVLRHGDSDTPGGDYKMELIKNPDTGVVSAYCVVHDDDGDGAGYIRGNGPLTSIADGHWHTIVCGRAADTVSLTVDGHTHSRPTRGNLGNVVGQARLLIGCQLGSNGVHKREQFVGRMDDITISVE